MINKFIKSFLVHIPGVQDFLISCKEMFLMGLAIPHEIEFKAIKQFRTKPGAIFLDVGANRGQSINSILLFCKPDVTIIAFEANPKLASKLDHKFGNRRNVSIRHFGLSKSSINKDLHIPFYKDWMFDGLSSFHPDVAKVWLRNNLLYFNERSLSIKRINCQCKRLDDLNISPCFIKIDVENYEHDVLLGGVETIKKNLPIILIESMDDSCIKIMRNIGYRFYKYDSSTFIPSPAGYNTFCLHPNQHEYLIN